MYILRFYILIFLLCEYIFLEHVKLVELVGAVKKTEQVSSNASSIADAGH